jgi:hypothetical protein
MKLFFLLELDNNILNSLPAKHQGMKFINIKTLGPCLWLLKLQILAEEKIVLLDMVNLSLELLFVFKKGQGVTYLQLKKCCVKLLFGRVLLIWLLPGASYVTLFTHCYTFKSTANAVS